MPDKNEIIEFAITAKMSRRWADQFCSMLKYMEYLGNLGSSKTVEFFCDGDGDFRPKFTLPLEIKTDIVPFPMENGNAFFDAG